MSGNLLSHRLIVSAVMLLCRLLWAPHKSDGADHLRKELEIIAKSVTLIFKGTTAGINRHWSVHCPPTSRQVLVPELTYKY